MIQSKPKSREEAQRDIEIKTIKFFQTVEAGDIALFNIFEEAIAVFGFTKVGKTTSCHIMCGSSLKGENQRGQLIFKSSTAKFTTAKIGINPESETEIPNIFEAVIKLPPGAQGLKFKKVPVLDQPGYGDTYGFHRIYSNGYFHYRTFSKTPKLKFILAFKKDDLIGTGEFFKKTIFNFINTFKNWEEVEESILKATSFLVTKADVSSKIQNLREIVLSLRDTIANLSPKQVERYQNIIDAVVKSDRLFFIEKPKNIYDPKLDDKILQQVYDRSEFWQRQINGNTVDMSNINFSVSKEIFAKLRDEHEEVFRMQFQGFMKYSDKRVSEIFLKDKASLSNIIQTLKSDAVESSDSRQVLADMAEFKQKYYKFREDLDFNSKRDAAIFSIFMEQNVGKWITTTKEDIDKEMKSDYFIKKFSVIDYLQDLYNRLIFEPEGSLTARTIESLQEFSSIFIGIFKKFSLLRDTPNDKTIYKYSYIIQRIIEEFKILTLIMFASEGVIQQIAKMSIYTPKMDIFFIFKDEFMTRALDGIDSNKLKQEFINKIDFSHLNNINPETINFFQSIQNKQEEVTFKIAKIIIVYSENIFLKDRIPPEEEKLYIGGKLYKYRNNFYAHLLNLKMENNLTQDVKEHIVEMIFSLTSRLAFILSTMNMYEEARKCFKSINNSESVFSIYDTQLTYNQADNNKKRELLLQYAQDAFFFHRNELALKCYQRVYALSRSYREMKQMSQKMVILCTDVRDGNEDYYLQRFQNQNFCIDYDQQLRSKIQFGLNYQNH